MKLDKNYDLDKHAERVHKLVKQTIGKGCHPDNKNISEFWEQITTPMPPRTYMYIMSTTQDVCFRSKGFSLLGLPDNWTFDWTTLLKLTHINQFKLVAYQTLFLYEAFIHFKNEMKETGLVYCTSRGVENVHSQSGYSLVHQVAYPIQYDESGYVTKYFCSFRILGDYQGEALETQVFTHSKFPKEQKKLRELLALGKSNMLGVLKFTDKEQDVINLMAYTTLQTSKEIADNWGISKRTIENHKRRIFHKAKEAFPLNDFQTTNDVIKYLKKQLII